MSIKQESAGIKPLSYHKITDPVSNNILLDCTINYASMKHVFICFLALTFYPLGYLNAKVEVVDSLINSLENVFDDSERGDNLLQIASLLKTKDTQRAHEYAKEAETLISSIGNPNFEVQVLNTLASINLVLWKSDLALEYAFLAKEKAETIESKESIQEAFTNIATAHYLKGNLQKSMEFYQLGLEVFDAENQNKTTARILGNMGNILHSQGNREKALYFYQEAKRLYEKFSDLGGVSSCLLNIGTQYSKLDEHEKALEIYLEALKISKEVGIRRNEVLLHMNIANKYSALDYIELSQQHYNEALILSDQIKDKFGKAGIYYNLAFNEKKLGNCKLAKEYAHKSIEMVLASESKDWPLNSYSILADCYKEDGDFRNAYKYKSLFHEGRDSVYNVEKSEKIHEISAKYESERKEIENQLLLKEKEKNETIIKTQRIVSILGGLLMASLIATLIVIYKNFKNNNLYSEHLEKEVSARTLELNLANKQLEESNIELERFAFIASHDLKEPLKNINNFAGLLKENTKEGNIEIAQTIEYVDVILNSSSRMNQLIEEVLEFSRVGNSTETVTEFVDSILDDVVTSISSTIEQKNVQIEVDELPRAKVNQSYLFIVLKNLIENGIKYNDKERPIINIAGKLENNVYQLSVEDNGIGIDKKYFDRIFKMFQRLHNRSSYKGTGLGLSICRKIINQMGGDIMLESELGVGSKFTFKFPVGS